MCNLCTGRHRSRSVAILPQRIERARVLADPALYSQAIQAITPGQNLASAPVAAAAAPMEPAPIAPAPIEPALTGASPALSSGPRNP